MWVDGEHANAYFCSGRVCDTCILDVIQCESLKITTDVSSITSESDTHFEIGDSMNDAKLLMFILSVLHETTLLKVETMISLGLV
jgi:hypothetical protein